MERTVKIMLRISVAVMAALFFAPHEAAAKRLPRRQRAEQSVAASETVRVNACVTSGDITVRGWDHKEVRARARNTSQIQLQRSGPNSAPAATVTVALSGDGVGYRIGGVPCQIFGDVDLDVPKGATVWLRTGQGDIHVTGVAAAQIETQSGSVEIADLSKSVEASSLVGGIKLHNCAGRMNLRSVGGDILVDGARPVEAEEFLAVTLSGDISLIGVSHQKVNARATTGSISLKGPLARGGNYEFHTISGDVSLRLPSNASFTMDAKVSLQGDIVVGFPLSPAQGRLGSPQGRPGAPQGVDPQPGTPPPAPPPTTGQRPPRNSEIAGVPTARHIAGVYGTGDATIQMVSYSGTLSVQKE
jgi:hypothetical protein